MQSDYNYEVKIFLQGYYVNNTNVRKHSDVDIVAVQIDQFRPKYRVDVSKGFIQKARLLKIQFSPHQKINSVMMWKEKPFLPKPITGKLMKI